MSEIECLDGLRDKILYRQENCYVTITDESLDISMVAHDAKTETLVGLDMISALITMALENGIEKDEISGRIWEQSRNKNDLADHLSFLLVRGNTI